jgi:nucleotide-binding universal stress UspA family protein
MIRSILFPTDFSEVANSAFPLATALAEACGASLIALHISSSATRGSTDPEHDFPEPLNHSLRLERSITSKSKTEDYAEAIMRKAARRNCDLIVMASHGRSNVAQFFLGRSVAERVARESNTPAIILRLSKRSAKPVAQLSRIIYLTDLRPASRAVLPTVMTIARSMNARVDLMAVLGEGDVQPADDGRAAAESFFAEAGALDLLGDFTSIRGGMAGAVIERVAASGVDLVAFTSALCPASSAADARPTPTADYLIRHSPCPVLVMNPKF